MTSVISGNGDWKKSLIVVFLRGGADGLNMVSPIGEDRFHNLRPDAAAIKEGTKLDGFFALHPQLKALSSPFHEGDLAIIHGTGSEDSTRSHFEAQDLMEHAGMTAGGWIGRYLRSLPAEAIGPLAAIALGKAMPESLKGAPGISVFERLNDFSFGGEHARLKKSLQALYSAHTGALSIPAKDTFHAMERIEALGKQKYSPANGATYGNQSFALGMRELAQIIKADVGMLAATIDLPGWDSHLNQENSMTPRMKQLGDTLHAFWKDLGPRMETTTVVVMTEFGRRVTVNSAFGTDHGRGCAMFVMGKAIKGGQVIADWKGLEEDKLVGPGDLPVTINYRNALIPILRHHGAIKKGKDIFPDYDLKPIELV
ncbi:DUF1501 domain-containing protein [Verrucomicrobia bacterium]|nr:DUF1501 domain-containing protein [Verrucomicrobiota bacterium]